MQARFEGKIAIVTGGSSGVGEKVSRRLVAEGASVVIADINEAAAQKLAEELGSAASALQLNVAEEADWNKLVGRMERLDLMAHCAGITGFGSAEDFSVAQWHLTMNVNALGTALANQAAIELMKQSGGAIVNVGSTNAVRARPAMLPYSASKAAVSSITACVALHCAANDYAIRCNAVLPGAIDTPLIGNLADALGGRDVLIAKAAATHAMKRMAQPEEIAAAILYLLSDDASFVTGACMPVDGGMLVL